MPMSDFFAAVRRRWLLVLIGFLLTVGASGAAYVLSRPTYEITGTVVFLPPASSTDTGSPNPYLQLGGLRQAVDLVGVSLTDQSAQLELQQISKDVQFTAQADVQTNSPLLAIDVKDSSPETALRIRDILVSRVDVRLQAMQEAVSVAPKDQVTASVLTLDTEAVQVGRNRLRAAIVAGVVGMTLTLVVATLWDSRQLRLLKTRTARTEQNGSNGAQPEPTATDDEAPVSTPHRSASPQGRHELEEHTDAPTDARR